VAILGLGDPDWLTHQHFADKDEVSAPADLAAPAYTANAMVGIIPWVFDPGRIGPRRSVVSARRCDLAEGLVLPVLIVMFAEAIEAELLLRLALSRGARGLILERSMKTLVTAILLRRAQVDALELDSKLDPFNRESAQAARTGRGKRRPIV